MKKRLLNCYKILASFSQRNIEVGHILWSYKQPGIMLPNDLLLVSSAVHKVQEMTEGREPGSMTEPLQARMQIVYLFICLDF